MLEADEDYEDRMARLDDALADEAVRNAASARAERRASLRALGGQVVMVGG